MIKGHAIASGTDVPRGRERNGTKRLATHGVEGITVGGTRLDHAALDDRIHNRQDVGCGQQKINSSALPGYVKDQVVRRSSWGCRASSGTQDIVGECKPGRNRRRE